MRKLAIVGKDKEMVDLLYDLVVQTFKGNSSRVETYSSTSKIVDSDIFILLVIGEQKVKNKVPVLFRISNKMKGPRVFPTPLKMDVFLDEVKNSVRQMISPALNFSFGPYSLDVRHSKLVAGDSEVKLTNKEMALIITLYHADNRTKNRRELLEDIWEYDDGVDTHTLETHIYRLRKKIEQDVNNPKILVTTEEGYRLQA